MHILNIPELLKLTNEACGDEPLSAPAMFEEGRQVGG